MLVHIGVESELLRPHDVKGRLFQFSLVRERDLALSSLACTVTLHWAHLGEWDPDATMHACS